MKASPRARTHPIDIAYYIGAIIVSMSNGIGRVDSAANASTNTLQENSLCAYRYLSSRVISALASRSTVTRYRDDSTINAVVLTTT